MTTEKKSVALPIRQQLIQLARQTRQAPIPTGAGISFKNWLITKKPSLPPKAFQLFQMLKKSILPIKTTPQQPLHQSPASQSTAFILNGLSHLIPAATAHIVGIIDIIANYPPYKLALLARTEEGIKNLNWKHWKTYYGGGFACWLASGPSFATALMIQHIANQLYKENHTPEIRKKFLIAALSGFVGEGFVYAHLETILLAKHLYNTSLRETLRQIKISNGGYYPFVPSGAFMMGLRGISFYTGLLASQPIIKSFLQERDIQSPLAQSVIAALINGPIVTILSQIPANIATRQMETFAKNIPKKLIEQKPIQSAGAIIRKAGYRQLLCAGLFPRTIAVTFTMGTFDALTPLVKERLENGLRGMR